MVNLKNNVKIIATFFLVFCFVVIGYAFLALGDDDFEDFEQSNEAGNQSFEAVQDDVIGVVPTEYDVVGETSDGDPAPDPTPDPSPDPTPDSTPSAEPEETASLQDVVDSVNDFSDRQHEDTIHVMLIVCICCGTLLGFFMVSRILS